MLICLLNIYINFFSQNIHPYIFPFFSLIIREIYIRKTISDRKYEKIDDDIELRLFKVLHRYSDHDLSFVSALINRVVAASINQCIYTGARYTSCLFKTRC